MSGPRGHGAEGRGDFLVAAGSVVHLVGSMAVAQRWAGPSALPDLTVGGLAAHLGSQVLSVHRALTSGDGVTETPPVPVMEHYERVAWVRSGIDDESNVTIRRAAEEAAAPGHGELVASLDAAMVDLRDAFRCLTMPPAVTMPWWDWSLSFDDWLLTRTMEIVVHSDDLAVSVDLEPPTLPEPLLGPVLALLVGLALHRHGQPAVVRALARGERAIGISAF